MRFNYINKHFSQVYILNKICDIIEPYNDNEDKICLFDKRSWCGGFVEYTFYPRNGHTHQTLCEIVIFLNAIILMNGNFCFDTNYVLLLLQLCQVVLFVYVLQIDVICDPDKLQTRD